jgi:hypothetical protein
MDFAISKSEERLERGSDIKDFMSYVGVIGSRFDKKLTTADHQRQRREGAYDDARRD